MNTENIVITEKNHNPIISIIGLAGALIFNGAKKYPMFTLSFLITALFYWPALQHGSIDAGLLYSGDILAYYLPALMKTHALLSQHHFSAIDYSLFNGSSDFFLNANFFPLHPLLVVHSLLVPFKTATLQSTGRFLVLMLAIHSFLACYFSLKLFTRDFLFEFNMAVFIAVGFTFNWYMIASMLEPPFLFCASIVPWAIYGTLRYSECPSFNLFLRACFPIMLIILGGYLPMGFACLGMSAVLVAAKLLFIDPIPASKLEERIRPLIWAALAFFLALIIMGPYLYAAYKFLGQTTSSSGTNIFYSAQQLAELPQSFIRLISSHFTVPGPFAEFSVFWGIIALTIFVIFFLSSKARDSLSARDWRIFKVVGILYFATALAIYGENSVISSLVYYFVPQVGKMHIYQRFLLPAQLLFMVMIALMLKALLESRPQLIFKLALTFLALASFSCGFLMTYRSNDALMFGINNPFLFELILGSLFAGALLIPGKNFAYYSTIALFCLPALNQMYTLSQGGNTFVAARSRLPMALNSELQSQLVAYLKRFDNKKIIKYVDMTPLWNKSGTETFPKDFPYFVLNNINLSSYGGATFYLSALADYIHRMPVGGNQVTIVPDWQWLKNTGADFIIVTQEEIDKDPLLQDLINKNKTDSLYHLPNDAVIVPLQGPMINASTEVVPLYDNGYFRINPTAGRGPDVLKNTKFHSNDANHLRLEFEANAPTKVQYLFWNNPRLKYYLNGKKIKFSDDNGFQTLAAPAGKNTIEINYIHRPLILFWVFYTIFGCLLLSTFMPKRLMTVLKRKRKYEY